MKYSHKFIPFSYENDWIKHKISHRLSSSAHKPRHMNVLNTIQV